MPTLLQLHVWQFQCQTLGNRCECLKVFGNEHENDSCNSRCTVPFLIRAIGPSIGKNLQSMTSSYELRVKNILLIYCQYFVKLYPIIQSINKKITEIDSIGNILAILRWRFLIDGNHPWNFEVSLVALTSPLFIEIQRNGCLVKPDTRPSP